MFDKIKIYIKSQNIRRNIAPVFVVLVLCVILLFIPTNYEQDLYVNTERVKTQVLSVNNDAIKSAGIIQFGEQRCEVKILAGKFKGQTTTGINHLSGSLEKDKIFEENDRALVVIDYENGEIVFTNMIDHYRMNYEIILVLIFAAALIGFAGIIGFKALLSFIFTVLCMWKILIPYFLSGANPIILGSFMVVFLTSVVIGLVYGFDRRSAAAISGAVSGSFVTCVTAVIFVNLFKIHGAVMPYSESLLYSGYPDLHLTQIFIAGIFIASAGAVMDLAVDITSAVYEIAQKRPDISKLELIKSGLAIGRTVVGTMTTTLLLAYSGSYIALLMVFMAQGTPLINILNLKYVSAEILHTVVGSLGLVTVAPFTAVISGTLLAKNKSI